MLNAVNRKKSFTLSLVMVLIAFTVLFGCKRKEQPEVQQQPPAQSVEQVVQSQSETPEAAPQQPALRILYAGHPDSEREKDFVEFLSKHFEVVETGNLKAFTDSDAEGFDVTVFDYDGDGFKAPRPSISRNFSQPVVTVGVVGAFISGSQSLKTDYL